MSQTTYRGRQAYALNNGILEILVTVEGGHLAAVTDLKTKINPLWSPPWPTEEPSRYSAASHPQYGGNSESKLLSGILGHNLCLDIFGGPSDAEAAAGMTVHGEGSIVQHRIVAEGDRLFQTAELPESRLGFKRTIRLAAGQRTATVEERVENLSALDRPIAWTQHATLGPPFLEKGRTQFRATATKSKVVEHDFTGGKGYMKIGAEFDWPMVPCLDGKTEDMRVFTNRPVSGAFSTHLMDPAHPDAWFLAWNPTLRLTFGYRWKRSDFPWLGIWEENYSRTQAPWNGKTLTRGMEFGVSPFPETRKAMIERGQLFGVPSYRWLPARATLTTNYEVFLVPTEQVPERVPVDDGDKRQDERD